MHVCISPVVGVGGEIPCRGDHSLPSVAEEGGRAVTVVTIIISVISIRISSSISSI